MLKNQGKVIHSTRSRRVGFLACRPVMRLYVRGHLALNGSVHHICDHLVDRCQASGKSMVGWTHFLTNPRRDFSVEDICTFARYVYDDPTAEVITSA